MACRRSWLATVGEPRIAPVVGLIVTLVASAGLVGLTYYLFPATTGSHGYVWGSEGPFAVNWDPAFQTAESKNPTDSAALYWHPSTHGGGSSDSYISGGVLHVRENDLGSTGWDSYDNAVGQQGNFPWEDDCGHVVGAAPDWTCPRNSYGLRTLAWIGANTTLSVNATFLSRQGTGDYNIIIGVYFYFVDGPLPTSQVVGSYLEAQVRLTFFKANGGLMPVGSEDTWNPGFDYGYARVAAALQPGENITLRNYDLHALYASAMTKRGLPPSTPAIIIGVEPGVEGWGETLAVDFKGLSITSREPGMAGADPDLDQMINQNDVALVNSLMGTCPSDFGRYQWRADTNSTNPCIDQADLTNVQHYEGQSFLPSPVELSYRSINGIARSCADGRTQSNHHSVEFPSEVWDDVA